MGSAARIQKRCSKLTRVPSKETNEYALAVNGEDENIPFSSVPSQIEAHEFLGVLFDSDLSR